MNALCRSDLAPFFGSSAIVGVSCGVVLFVIGLSGRPPRVRQAGWIVVGGLGALALVGLLAVGLAAYSARPFVQSASTQTDLAIDAANNGDYDVAAARFDAAARSFGHADRLLGGPLALPAKLIPGVAQNVAAASDLSAVAAAGTAQASRSLQGVDATALRFTGGRIDVDAVRSLEAPLSDVDLAMNGLEESVASMASPWLVGRFRDELADLELDLAENQARLSSAIDAVQLAPQMLGADELRRYLVLFVTPAEARGIAGFVGNYAVVEVDSGSVSVTEFGRRSDLDEQLRDSPAICTGCSQEVLDRYGDFGLDDGPDGTASPTVWLNVTMPAHFPNTAETAHILFPQSGGQPIDGVVAVDPYVIEALMRYTGPIPVPELDVVVGPEDAAEFILERQYVLAGDESLLGVDNQSCVDALQTLGEGVIQRLLTGALPEPAEIARDLGPLVAEHRLMMWTDLPAEQELLEAVGLLGAMPELGPDGGFSVIVANTGENKIDVFLERDVDVRIEVLPDGARELVADVVLHNTAPSSGLPRYVIGNGFGLPAGTSRLRVNFFGPPSLVSAQLDGVDVAVEALPEAGWMGYATDVVIPPGSAVEYELRFALGPTPATVRPWVIRSSGPSRWWSVVHDPTAQVRRSRCRLRTRRAPGDRTGRMGSKGLG